MPKKKEATTIPDINDGESIQPEEILYSREAQLRYRRILDLQKSAIHVVNRDLRLVFYNAFAREWAGRIGYSLDEECLGKNLFDVFPFLDTKIFISALET